MRRMARSVIKEDELPVWLQREIDVATKKLYGGLVQMVLCGNSLEFFSLTTRGVTREIKKLCRSLGYRGEVKVRYV